MLFIEMKNAIINAHELQPGILAWVFRQQNAILLETSRPGGGEARSYFFLNPLHIVQCACLSQVENCLAHIHQALRDGYHAAGFLGYEAGYAFEKRLATTVRTSTPLLWFGIYDAPAVYNHHHQGWERGGKKIAEMDSALRNTNAPPAQIENLHVAPTLGEAEYHRAITAIKNHIAAGDTYQVNFTFKLKFPFRGSAAALYCHLRQRQRVGYAALLSCGAFAILSFSPELFFRIYNRRMVLKPMKGTAPRGRTPEEDERQRLALRHSEKNRAENLMIVDLLRNDAGRIARTGSVRVQRFFDLEGYETVWQATSTITAELRPRITVVDLMRCLFPSGSVTGAPKIRTMQIIRELEKEPRGVYCGSIGFFAPHLRHAVFNVAIRTLALDQQAGTGEMGVGSGVVWDSDAASEYRECLLKSRFLHV